MNDELFAELLASVREGGAILRGEQPASRTSELGLREVQGHLLVKVTDFAIVGDYTVRVRFDDDTEQIINFESVLYGRLFGPLRDLAFFNQVRLDPEIHTLVWPNDADFDPATLYHWHDGEGEELADN